MQTPYLLLCIIFIQGVNSIQYFLQCLNLACVLDYTNEKPSLLNDKSCITVDDNAVTDVDYQFSQEAIADFENGFYSAFTLKRSPFNITSETVNTYRYSTDVRMKGFSVDWIHNTVYIVLDRVVSASIAKSDQLISLNDVITIYDVAAVTGVSTKTLDIKSVKIDPYRRYLFVLVYNRARYPVREFIVIRSDLNGKQLLKVLVTPISNDDYRLYVDINGLKLYVTLENTTYVYNYEGEITRELHLPLSPMDVAVFNDNIYLASYPKRRTTTEMTTSMLNAIHEISINQSQEIRNVYYLNTTGHCSVGVLDARVKRRKKDGKYICDRTDCPELCKVEPSGDTCVCLHTKAKARDGVMCYDCGQSNLTSLLQQPAIVNGQVSYPSNFPWQTAIYNTKNLEQVCGGTLISSQVVLTAAHCVTLHCVACTPTVMKPEDLKVALGKTQRSWNITEPYDVRRNVSKILVEDIYMGLSANYANDIALLFLDSKVSTNRHVMPACLDYNLNQLPLFDTLTGYVSGFGFTKDCRLACSNYSDTLLYTTGTALNLSDCLRALNAKDLSSFHTLTPDKFCVGNGTVSAVQTGDSGGGFTVVFKGLHYVTGVVSSKLMKYDKNLKLKYSFGGFTNISTHMDWLKHNIIE